MEALAKLELLGGQMGLEPAEERRPQVPGGALPAASPNAKAPCGHSPAELRQAFDEGQLRRATSLEPKKNSLGIHQAVTPGGGRIALLKTLLTSACELDCYYCPFRARRNFRRATFKPDEMAQVFSDIHRGGAAQGLFLSSGVAGGGVRTQDRLIATADILRNRLGFRGYLHLKIMPGAGRAQVERAMQLADRISVNLEAPNTLRLQSLAPHKQFTEQLLQPLRWAEEIRRTQPARLGWKGRWPSTVTQFVVGGQAKAIWRF